MDIFFLVFIFSFFLNLLSFYFAERFIKDLEYFDGRAFNVFCKSFFFKKDLIISILISLIFAYLIKFFTLGELFFEIFIFNLLFSSCLMDLKTLSIDSYLSNFVLGSLLVKFFIFNTFNFLFVIYSMCFFAFLSLVLFLVYKKSKKTVIGRADIDFFIGIIPYFQPIYLSIFLIFSGLFGIFTKLLLNFLSFEFKKNKELPFIPGIFVSFYFTRFIQYKAFHFLEKLTLFI